MEVKNEPHQYQWIINEGLLRDEGTLFGMAGAGYQEKITAIRDYYLIQKAAAATRREGVEKEIERLNAELSGNTFSKSGDPRDRGSGIRLLPIVLQLLLYGGICYFNFFLEVYWLSPVLHSTVICVGLYLFGLFSVFMGRSVMYNAIGALADGETTGARRESWKIYLEEFGVPLVTSLFISILPGRAYPLHFSIIVGVLFFLLFLLGGKGLVNIFFRVREESGWFFRRIGNKLDHKRNTRRLIALQTDLSMAVAALKELDGEEAYKINIFTSEYNLAYGSRHLNSELSMKKLA